MIVYHSVQLSHNWSDFSRLLMTSETKHLCHFILVLLSSTLMKQLTCNVALFLLYLFLVWIFSWRGFFQVTGTDASCVLYIIYSQFIICSAYCAWFVTLLAPPYAALLRTCPYCFQLNLIVQFTSKFSLSCTDLCKVSTEDSDHVIS